MIRVYKVIGKSFFARSTIAVARNLLGTCLVRRVGRTVLSGKIVETEAYCGEDDLACHASRGRTKRTEILYAKPGTIYIYLIYGMYWCLNIVTEREDFPSAVLIRAVEPVEGVTLMMRRRGTRKIEDIANGPGKLCEAFGITGRMHGKPLGPETLWIEGRGGRLPARAIGQSPRIGVDYAKGCARYPWRFFVKDSPYVSRRS